MSDRARKLVLYLEQCGTWKTAAALASVLECSARTVKTDVSQLNEAYPGIISSSSRGYRLGAAESVDAFLGEEPAQSGIPQTAQERRTQILCKLLMRHNELGMEELADELCISLTTLDNEVQAINADLSPQGVSLRTRAGNLYVAGDEDAKKRVVSDLLFDETRDFFNQLELVDAYFPDVDIKSLRIQIDDCLKNAGFFINGYSLSNVILHLSIAIERCLNGFSAAESFRAEAAEVDAGVARVADEILDNAEAAYGIVLSPDDRAALTMILSTCLVSTGEEGASCCSDEAVSQIVDHICARVGAEYSIELSDGEFGARFALHLENMLARVENNVVLRNPQRTSIKDAYPYVYEIAVFIAEIIQSETQLMASEDEIAFIALHIGCFIEEQGQRGNRLAALVVGPRYNPAGASLPERLVECFPHDLLVEAVVEDPDELKFASQADIIISTQELHGRFAVPVVRISPFLGEVDRALIRSRIDDIRQESRRRTMERSLYTFFRSEFFFVDTGFENEHDAIEAMGDALIEAEFAFPNFKECLYSREAISSSVYRDIAMPHPIDMDAIQTAVALSLHPEPISWMGEPVHAVLMLCVTREDRSFFREVFEFVAHVLNEPATVRTLSRARTYDEFMEMLLKYC